MSGNDNYQDLLNVRTVTGFIQLNSKDFEESSASSASAIIEDKIERAVGLIRKVQAGLEEAGYTVQTIRLATNPFAEWLSLPSSGEDGSQTFQKQLERLDTCLEKHNIGAFSLGSAESPDQVLTCCAKIVAASSRFYCSATMGPTDTAMARAAAHCVKEIAAHCPEGNFQFCAAAHIQNNLIPYFPVARSATGQPASAAAAINNHIIRFAIGLENGVLARHLLKECGSIDQINTVFRTGMAQALAPIQAICRKVADAEEDLDYVGIDSSLNPSLDPEGSVAGAMEELSEVPRFAGPGTLAAAATLTRCLQTLPDIQLSGYCGLMLPLCEDTRLAELSGAGLRIADLLSISHVCGVGVDTVPIEGNVDEAELALLILDVAAIAHRWGKSLSCRVFPVPQKKAGELTSFDSPYLVNASILPLSP